MGTPIGRPRPLWGLAHANAAPAGGTKPQAHLRVDARVLKLKRYEMYWINQ